MLGPMPGAFHPIAAPFGELGAAFDAEGKLIQLVRLHGASLLPPDTRTPKSLPFLKRQLEAYFQGALREFDLPVAPRGTAFQLRVWAELRRIPYGLTISYGELARRLGDPNLTRAVGAANGANPISIIFPCHRVIGADGSLTGYGGGLEVKRALLALERGSDTQAQAFTVRPLPLSD